MPQLRACIEFILETVEHRFRGDIKITVNLIAHHLALLCKFALREHGVFHKVGYKLHGTCRVAVRKGRIDIGLLLGGERVQLAPHSLHAVDYVRRMAACGALEDGMFHKVRQSVGRRSLVAAAHVDGHSEIVGVRLCAPAHEPKPVGQRKSLHVYRSHHLPSDFINAMRCSRASPEGIFFSTASLPR